MQDDDAENDNNEHDEEIEAYVKSLKNERKVYYYVLDGLINNYCNKMKKLCEEAQIDSNKNAKN